MFSYAGDDVDRGYHNLRTGKFDIERELVAELESMWRRFQPYADPDFIEGFAKDPDGRFWELWLGCFLAAQKRDLVPAAEIVGRRHGAPDFCIQDEGRRVWIEAVAPDRGDEGNPDRIPHSEQPLGGRMLRPAPREQVHLRITGALRTKKDKFDRYIHSGLIADEDLCVVAINGGRFALDAMGGDFPRALSAVFPIGNEFVRVNVDNGEIVGQGHHPSWLIPRRQGDGVARDAFVSKTYERLSGLIWSRVSIGNFSRQHRPVSYVHNPMCPMQLPEGFVEWDREFLAQEIEGGYRVTDILLQQD